MILIDTVITFWAVPSTFCLRGQTLHTFTGVSHIQTGFLVGRFVFTPTQKVFFKTFKETNHTDGISTLFSFPSGGNCPSPLICTTLSLFQQSPYLPNNIHLLIILVLNWSGIDFDIVSLVLNTKSIFSAQENTYPSVASVVLMQSTKKFLQSLLISKKSNILE